jgi:hypothetical protein
MIVEINQLGPNAWEQRVFTTARPDLVFDYMADFDRHIEWEHELASVKPLGRRTGTTGNEVPQDLRHSRNGPRRPDLWL